jgi:hypothetical protein
LATLKLVLSGVATTSERVPVTTTSLALSPAGPGFAAGSAAGLA